MKKLNDRQKQFIELYTTRYRNEADFQLGRIIYLIDNKEEYFSYNSLSKEVKNNYDSMTRQMRERLIKKCYIFRIHKRIVSQK